MRTFQYQRISAVVLLVFMTIHMVVVHYPPFHIDFSRIIDRMSQPLWKAIDIGFLFFVLLHAMAGMYVVLTDLNFFHRYRRPLLGALTILGLAAMVYGSQTILAFTG